ncbi:MAG: DUF501 domain-containing protein [bacterium]|nr:DUF501 domain-containing protein [bacterium]MCP4968546.1 DUF501 domain-containing protein [bacterium]
MDDREVVASQIGREPRSVVDVVARCHLALPTVIRVPPHLDDGTPFPTTYWLTCPLALRRVGRLEGAGGVKKAEALIDVDPAFAAAYRQAMERYETERDALIDGDAPAHRPSGGVGGTRLGVKCLHAHYADHAAGNANPVGADTAASIEPLNCAMPCVAAADHSVARNPDWVEPR